jgi:hypothetical protein
VDALLAALDAQDLPSIQNATQAVWQADQAFAADLVDVRPYLLRLHQFAQAWMDVSGLRDQIVQGAQAGRYPAAATLRRHGGALQGAVGALLTTWLTYELWRQSGWDEAALACMFGAMASSIFAAGQPGAVRKTIDYLVWSSLGAALAALYLYAILPHAGAAWLLPVVLAVAYIPLGTVLVEPAWSMRIMPLTSVAAGQLAFLQGHKPPALGFINAWLAPCLGICVAVALAWLLAPKEGGRLQAAYSRARRAIASVLSHRARPRSTYPQRALARTASAAERHADDPEALVHLSAYHRLLANAFLLDGPAPPASQATSWPSHSRASRPT